MFTEELLMEATVVNKHDFSRQMSCNNVTGNDDYKSAGPRRQVPNQSVCPVASPFTDHKSSVKKYI